MVVLRAVRAEDSKAPRTTNIPDDILRPDNLLEAGARLHAVILSLSSRRHVLSWDCDTMVLHQASCKIHYPRQSPRR